MEDGQQRTACNAALCTGTGALVLAQVVVGSTPTCVFK